MGSFRPSLPEISDVVVTYDEGTLARAPVRRDEVLDRFSQLGMTRAKDIVAAWPHAAGRLDDRFVDGVLVRAHLELQRLSEEFQQGARVQRLLVPLLQALRASGVRPPTRSPTSAAASDTSSAGSPTPAASGKTRCCGAATTTPP